MFAGTAIWLGWGLAPSGRAQWVTQTNTLRTGWNAVSLHVNASHATIGELVGAGDPIEEIWLWNPALPPGQMLATPQLPVGSQWASWTRTEGDASILQTLYGNASMLVRVRDGVSSFAWKIKGRPVAPHYRWSLTGLNFIGFPTPPAAPTFESFLGADAQALDWAVEGQVFRYQGGHLGMTNPIIIPPVAYRTTPVRRDHAYWVRTGDTYNQYFGPFQVRETGSSGIRFGASSSQTRFVLQNMTPTPLTVTMRQVGSEAPPAGIEPAVGTLPLLVRGSLNASNLTFGYTSLGTGVHDWLLAPKGQKGSEVEVVLGLNRMQMNGAAGAAFEGILRFTDSLGLSQVDVGASAQATSREGLWVGRATVAYVGQYLKNYARAETASDLDALLARLQLEQGGNGYRYAWEPTSGRVLVFGGPDNRTGSYLLDGPIKLDAGGVARPFPLRLILHNDGAMAFLLQRVYLGVGMNSNLVVATGQEALLPSELATARRITSVHLPTADGNLPWAFTGTLTEGQTLTTTVTLAHDDDGSNPFLHAYHPDHDNLDALFDTPLPAGVESYGVRRVISLQIQSPSDDFESLTQGGTSLAGNYAETVTFLRQGGDTKSFSVLGMFRIHRITDIATLTTP